MGRGGFEPPKAEPTDLQSVPFGHSGTSPKFWEKHKSYKAGQIAKQTPTAERQISFNINKLKLELAKGLEPPTC